MCMYFRKVFCIILILLNCIIWTHGQSTLLGEKNWQTVVSGAILSKPEASSYGFVVMTEGRLLNAFSENGIVLWQKTLAESGEGFCSSMNGDFVYAATNKSLSLYNTSGNALWTVKTETKIIEKPLSGWDGRVFVREKNAISSYNLSGLLRFKLLVSEGRDFPLMTLNDGSLLYIQKKELNGKSTALRISPFGIILEEIIFVDRIVSGKEGPDGIFLALENGSLALCQVVDGVSDTSWSIKLENKAILDLFPWDKNILVQCKDGSFILFDGKNKDALWLINNLDINKIQSFVFDKDTLLLLSKNAIISIDKKGFVEKNIHLQNLSSFSSLTNSGFFIDAKSDWTITAYRIASLARIENVSLGFKKKYQVPPLHAESISLYTQATQLLQKENIFEKEEAILSRLRIDMQDIQTSYLFTKRPSQNYDTMPLKIASLEKASFLGTAEAKSFFETILEKETDESVLLSCLKAIQKSPYDFDMGLLKAIELRLLQSSRASDAILEEYSYTITEICRFMGRKVLIKKGKDLLFGFLDTKYSAKVQNTARICLEKLIAFEK